jgi:hypothetical protein
MANEGGLYTRSGPTTGQLDRGLIHPAREEPQSVQFVPLVGRDARGLIHPDKEGQGPNC